jgi:hypothetical protein
MRRLTASLPPCLFVPHTVAAWRSPQHGQAVVAGEALATVGVCTLAALLQGVSVATVGVCTLAALLQGVSVLFCWLSNAMLFGSLESIVCFALHPTESVLFDLLTP